MARFQISRILDFGPIRHGSKPQIQPRVWRMRRLTQDGTAEPVSQTKFSGGANGDRGKHIFPAQPTTSRIGNLTRLIHTPLAYKSWPYILWYCINSFWSEIRDKKLRRRILRPDLMRDRTRRSKTKNGVFSIDQKKKLSYLKKSYIFFSDRKIQIEKRRFSFSISHKIGPNSQEKYTWYSLRFLPYCMFVRYPWMAINDIYCIVH